MLIPSAGFTGQEILTYVDWWIVEWYSHLESRGITNLVYNPYQ